METKTLDEKTIPEKFLSFIRSRDTKKIKKMIEEGHSVDTKCTSSQQSLVVLASSNGDYDTVLMLIEKGCDVNFFDDTRTSAALLACSKGYPSILQLLIENNLDKKLLSLRDFNEFTCAHYAAQSGHVDILEILRTNAAELNIIASPGITPSLLAANMGRKEVLIWFENHTDIPINSNHLNAVEKGLTVSSLPNFNRVNIPEAAKFRTFHVTNRMHLETQHWILGECNRCRKHGSTQKCSRCNAVFYCSVDCQRVDWKTGGHKQACPTLQAPVPVYLTVKEPATTNQWPCYFLNLDRGTQTFLVFSTRVPMERGYIWPIAMDLLKQNLIRVETDVTDESKFIPNVYIIDDQHTKKDQIVVYIHREVIRLMCGEEGVEALESHRRLCTTAWVMIGEGRLNVIKRRLR